ncbi:MULTISPECIES: helix-turn-helix transcriptional regulator [Pirellulaceae]|nr:MULTISPECIES: AraC family transcriptional regulator [Pirellulaceae]
MMADTFREFEAYASAIEDADLRLMLPKLGQPRWELCSFHLGEIHLQYGSEWSGIIAEGASRSDGQILFVPLHGDYRTNGIPLENHSVFLIDAASEFTISVFKQHAWCSVYLPWHLLTGSSHEIEYLRASSARHQVTRLPSDEIASTRRLLIQLQRMVRNQPSALTSTFLSTLVRREMVSLWRRLHTIACEPVSQTGRPLLHRNDLIRTVRQLIESQPNESLTIDDLVSATRVSERTLRSIFLEFYGLPPQRYLMIRRLNQAHATLRSADPETTTVTNIAARYGFWHFGRFAGAYGKLFGETPSATLHARERTQESFWIGGSYVDVD